MSGRRGEDGSHDVNGSADAANGADRPELDLVAQVLREEPYLAAALEVLPAALDPVDLPAGAWHKLSAALTDLGPGATDAAVPGAGSPSPAAVVEAAARPRTHGRPGWIWAQPLTWLSAAVVAALVVGLGTWGVLQAGERARLVDEQRVLAYWMANPDLKMVALQGIGASAAVEGAGQSGRLGVVCVLPDGRALLLQPTPAGRGKSYVVVSSSAADDSGADLGAGTGNVIRFDLAGAQRVVVMLASRNGERVPIAWADVN